MTHEFDAATLFAGALGVPRPGVAVTEPAARTRPVELVTSVAGFLSRLHDADPGAGPDRSPSAVLDAIATSAAARGGSSDDPKLIGARALCPPPPERLAVTGGGLRLASLEIDDGQVCNWEPTRWAGVGDPAWDVASLARDLSDMVGPEAGAMLLDSYTPPPPSMLRLEFWALIDQIR